MADNSLSKAAVAALARTVRLEERRYGVAVGIAYFGPDRHGPGAPERRTPFHSRRLRENAWWPQGFVPAANISPRRGEALRRAIERRLKQVVVPGTQRLAVALPGLAQAMVDRILRS
jgi:hypothetical protein